MVFATYILPILTNPRFILTAAFLVAVTAVSLYGWNKYSNAIENEIELKQELKIEREKVAVLNSELENKNEIMHAIEENMTRIDEINKTLYNRIEYNNSLVRNLRNKLDSIDFQALMQKNPKEVSNIFTNAFRRRLECIETATGKQGTECIE